MNKATKARSGLRGTPRPSASGVVSRSGGDVALAADLRDRLLERMRDARVPDGHQQEVHLAAITGRVYQTTRRWIDPSAPGLPDLASFRQVCEGVDGDPSWLLGFVSKKRSLRQVVAEAAGDDRAASEAGEWMTAMVSDVRQQMSGCRARRMQGDEMEPEIGDGDTMFIDFDVTEFGGNGTYLIACDGRELVRALEYRVGTGLVLTCTNRRYPETVVRDAAESVRRHLKVLGRVEGVIQLRRFWRPSAVPKSR